MNLLRPTPDRLTKHLLPRHTIQAADSSTPLRSAQNDSALMTSNLEVTHDVYQAHLGRFFA